MLLVLFAFVTFKIYFWLYWVFIAVLGLSLVWAGGGYSLAAVWGLLIVAVFLAEHRLQGMQASVAHGLTLWHVGSSWLRD